MTAPSLTLGCILLGFSPTASLLFMVVLRKPQLVILAVCSAFAYLLSALLSSTIWLVTSSIAGAVGGGSTSGIGTAISIAVPGVACQMLLRCLFVRTYFRVETVIRGSVEKHERETREAAAASSGGGAGNSAADEHAETDALQLQLNDTSCGLASGCGYALLHSLLLYGTLLARVEQLQRRRLRRGGRVDRTRRHAVPGVVRGGPVRGQRGAHMLHVRDTRRDMDDDVLLGCEKATDHGGASGIGGRDCRAGMDGARAR